ncbi:unnamed protein product [Brassicogethes aeneus]|uniref:Uncharacterized protein n=1 Tax=Brassicogethes aeneus TaxID=1431903 RepID=A0A9P0B3G4_BRAAE|nr:unnamed protein product [Brassicogethes aeneus]
MYIENKMAPRLEKRTKFVPAKIKLNQTNTEIFVDALLKNVKVRVLQDLSKEKTTTNDNKSETSILTKSRFDYSGSAPKRYTTSCYIKPTPVPIWYTESLTLKINSTKRTYREQVYFKVKQRPYKWSETMTTEVMTCPKLHQNEAVVSVENSDFHYISLEPQQIAAK